MRKRFLKNNNYKTYKFIWMTPQNSQKVRASVFMKKTTKTSECRIHQDTSYYDSKISACKCDVFRRYIYIYISRILLSNVQYSQVISFFCTCVVCCSKVELTISALHFDPFPAFLFLVEREALPSFIPRVVLLQHTMWTVRAP